MRIRPRESYDHPGPLGPRIDLSRVTGWDFHHTAGGLGETPRAIAQATHDRFGRSSYNFIIDDAHPGDAHEMQGLHIGAHNDGENSTRIGLCFIGYFHPPVNHKPSATKMETAAQLLAHGYTEWGVPIHAKGHRDSDATACPGNHLYEQIDAVVRRAKELATMADHDHELTEMPDWGGAEKRYWDRFVGDGVTSAPKSWKRPVWRLDLAWLYNETIVPLRNQLSEVTGKLRDLERSSGGGGLTEADVRRIALDAVRDELND